ncbi:pentatricopeptide repeat-containing protein [Candidatus Parcubacteria bacterium]|nr:hypothetical protein [Patescibacteria group bacterium]MBU4309830.1 hypothetical protein [Patescibacteria group bacterium]MBU4432574.1 hypothetical protein [Patescibacteria group bacterium]MBU4578169.1 hypothetical protein [Patescibacteria group bacterium]MCG2696706.1 pentatricopeptide repeat-containing protein [Candidatus Parcubacteria bacterium]
MLKFKRRTYDNARQVSRRAKELRNFKLIKEADILLRAAIIEWPNNLFLYNQLLCCQKDTSEAWRIFLRIKRSGLIADRYTYGTLINIYFLARKEKHIVERLDPGNIPIDALPTYAEALRKIKSYEDCIKWCDVALSHSDKKEIREHAWINKLYCYMHIDGKEFLQAIANPLLSLNSPYYYRYIAAKVYGGAYEDWEKSEIEDILKKALENKTHKNLGTDISHALSIIQS